MCTYENKVVFTNSVVTQNILTLRHILPVDRPCLHKEI
jgi:DNA-binding winged helix-turn-helix (wHTH) protein